MRRMNDRGMAVVLVLVTLVVTVGVLGLLFARTSGEVQHSGDDLGIARSLALARGTASAGGLILNGPVRETLAARVRVRAGNGAWAFGDGAGDRPDPVQVAAALEGLAADVQADVDRQLCGRTFPTSDGEGQGRLWIFFSDRSCGARLPRGVRRARGRFVSGGPRSGSGAGVDQTYALPFIMIAEGAVGPYRRNIVISGEYRFTIGRGSFARYALFTNIHLAPSGADIWFTSDTLFDGPVHTNMYYRFYEEPWFGGEVTSAGCSWPAADGSDCPGDDYSSQGAVFWGEGFVPWQRMRPSYEAPAYPMAEPVLAGGVDWQSAFVPMPENANDQRDLAQSGGLYFDDDLTELALWTGDADGNPPAWDPGTGRWEPPAEYQFLRACWLLPGGGERCRVWRLDAAGKLEYQDTGGGWRTAQDPFNGVIYVEGDVYRLHGPARSDPADRATAPPALAAFSQLTLATAGSLRITGDLTYEQPPCTSFPERQPDGSIVPATCEDLDARNVLGLFAQDGDILIGHNHHDDRYNAPPDLTVHGVLMSSRGAVQVEDYTAGWPLGRVHLIGGIIENLYGGFGTFDPASGEPTSGYGRRFVYDRRMARGLAPPGFPTTNVDTVKSVVYFAYGQREQLNFNP